MEKLLGTQKLSLEEVEQYIAKWQGELFAGQIGPDYAREKNRSKPWKRQDDFQKSDVDGKLHIVLADGVYVDALNLKPRLQNQIRCLAAFDNPVFYKNKRLGYSNYYHFSMVYMGEDVDGYIKIPRGLLEALLIKCRKAELSFDIITPAGEKTHVAAGSGIESVAGCITALPVIVLSANLALPPGDGIRGINASTHPAVMDRLNQPVQVIFAAGEEIPPQLIIAGIGKKLAEKAYHFFQPRIAAGVQHGEERCNSRMLWVRLYPADLKTGFRGCQSPRRQQF